jgi:hypothetical protein
MPDEDVGNNGSNPAVPATMRRLLNLESELTQACQAHWEAIKVTFAREFPGEVLCTWLRENYEGPTLDFILHRVFTKDYEHMVGRQDVSEIFGFFGLNDVSRLYLVLGPNLVSSQQTMANMAATLRTSRSRFTLDDLSVAVRNARFTRLQTTRVNASMFTPADLTAALTTCVPVTDRDQSGGYQSGMHDFPYMTLRSGRVRTTGIQLRSSG